MKRTHEDIRQVSNWGYWFEVDGKRLKGSTRVWMVMPNGIGYVGTMDVECDIYESVREGAIGTDRLVLRRTQDCCTWSTPWVPGCGIGISWDDAPPPERSPVTGEVV